MDEKNNKIESKKAVIENQLSKNCGVSAVMRFLFKEPKKDGQGKIGHFIRQVGRMIFVGNLCFFVMFFAFNFIMYRLIQASLWPEGFEVSVYSKSILVFIISLVVWKGKQSDSGDNKFHKSKNFATDPAYSSCVTNVFHRNR